MTRWRSHGSSTARRRHRRRGPHRTGARLLAIADALLERAGGEWPPDEREQHDGTLAAVSADLSPAELEAVRAGARSLSLAEAVDLALG
jgi:hypothetical protein